MKTIATAIAAVLTAVLAISGCSSTHQKTARALEKPKTVQACSETGVVRPRMCDVSCNNNGMIKMRCSGECGAAMIVLPDNAESCAWEAPWRLESGENVSVQLGPRYSVASDGRRAIIEGPELRPKACGSTPGWLLNGQSTYEFGLLCSGVYRPYRQGDIYGADRWEGDHCLGLGPLGRKRDFLMGLSQQCSRSESWKGQVKLELALSGDWKILPSTFKRF